jgi:hypothetical protein
MSISARSSPKRVFNAADRHLSCVLMRQAQLRILILAWPFASSGSGLIGLAASRRLQRARRPRTTFFLVPLRTGAFVLVDFLLLLGLPVLRFFTAPRFAAVRAFVPERAFGAERVFVVPLFLLGFLLGCAVLAGAARADVAASSAVLGLLPNASETRSRTTPAAAVAAAPSASVATFLTPFAPTFAASTTAFCVVSKTPLFAIFDLLQRSRLNLL